MNQLSQPEKITNSFSGILIATGLLFLGIFLGSSVAVFALSSWYGVPADQIGSFLNLDSLRRRSDGKMILFFYQGLSALGGFFLSSWVYLRLIERKHFKDLHRKTKVAWMAWVLVVLITLLVMPLTSLVIEWNMGIHFPSFMEGFEQWAWEKEQSLQAFTQFLTDFTHLEEVIIGLIVMALIPAVGEELFFRGILQRSIGELLNIHVAIWLSAIVFSAIHLQFYGFFPRMLLGALFGYLYYWSGNLYIPMLGHFVNNAFTLIMIYLYHQGVVSFNLAESGASSWLYASLSLLMTGTLLYYFRYRFFKLEPKHSNL